MYLLISSGWWFSVTLKMICRTYKVLISYKLHNIKLHAHTKTNSKMLYVAEDKAIIQVYQKEMPFHISKYKVRHLGAKHVNFHCSVVIKKKWTRTDLGCLSWGFTRKDRDATVICCNGETPVGRCVWIYSHFGKGCWKIRKVWERATNLIWGLERIKRLRVVN